MIRILLIATILLSAAACSSDPEQSYPVKVVRGGQGAKTQLSQVDMQILQRALELFRFDIGRYPTTQEGLQALLKNPGLPKWRQYVSNPVAIQGFKYQSDGKTFRLSPLA